MPRGKFLFALGALTMSMLYSQNSLSDDTYTRSIDRDAVNLSAGEFFESYVSKDENIRDKANLYLIGVMDTTEGKTWCGYDKLKTVTVRERVYLGLKGMSEIELENRASGVIEGILGKRYPCKDAK